MKDQRHLQSPYQSQSSMISPYGTDGLLAYDSFSPGSQSLKEETGYSYHGAYSNIVKEARRDKS